MAVSLITGGAGFIGSHVSREALKLGHKVIILDDLSGGFQSYLPDEVTFIKGSVTDEDLVSRVFSENKIDFVYHLAAYAAEGLSHFIKRFNYTNNLIGSVNLINESIKHKVKCFVFTSSIAVYGKLDPPMKEDMIPVPEDPYGIAKLAVEMELRVSHEMFGLNYVIFRPHNVYGEFQNIGDKYRNVVGIFMNQLMTGQPLTIFGDGNQTRAFSYVGDIAHPIANCVNVKHAHRQVINIGAEKDYSINDLAHAVMKAMNLRGTIRYVEPRNEVKHAFADHSKAGRIFGTYAQTSLEDGLMKMASWTRATGALKSKDFEDIEIYEKLPPVWISKA